MPQPPRKRISIVTPCFNEEENVAEVHRQVAEVMASLPAYDYEHLFIDNASTDRTVAILRELASADRRVKVIVNARNFGHIRSPMHGLFQARGDAAVLCVADLQDPPKMIVEFVRKWEEGFKVVVGAKCGSDESKPMFMIRRLYYRVITRLSETPLIRDFTGFGLYDRAILDILRQIRDPYPYFRGLICEVGFDRCAIEYHQPVRRRGLTKNNFYTLYDMAMLGLTNHSKVPLRLMTMLGFALGTLSLSIAFVYLVLKLVFWSTFSLGLAPIIIGMFFLASVQLFFLGVVGEYVGAIYTQVRDRPLVVERERINFGSDEDSPER